MTDDNICPDCDGEGCPYCGGPDADYHTMCFNCDRCKGTGYFNPLNPTQLGA